VSFITCALAIKREEQSKNENVSLLNIIFFRLEIILKSYTKMIGAIPCYNTQKEVFFSTLIWV
jgi:hypothetical protein